MITKRIVVPHPEFPDRLMKFLFSQEEDDSNDWTWTCHMTNEAMEDISKILTVETKLD